MSKIRYYASRISPHISRTPEGYIICHNVPIARTGYQQYLDSELHDGGDNHIIQVYRPADEVFSTASLASYEGKPICNNHPAEDVTPYNIMHYSKGHVQHVRRGDGEDSNKIIADLYITDPALIAEVLHGKRAVSAGYYADEDYNGDDIMQRNIRCNHIAIVNDGRAGASVAIRDHTCARRVRKGNDMTRKMKGKARRIADSERQLRRAKILARYLMDATPEDVKERLSVAGDEIDEVLEAEPEPADELHADECRRTSDDADDVDVDEGESADDVDVDVDEGESADDVDIDIDSLEDDAEDIDIITPDEDVAVDVDAEKEKKENEAQRRTDAAIRKIAAAANDIRDKRDRRKMLDAILRVAGSGKQMRGLMQTVAANQRKRSDAAHTSNISIAAQQAKYDINNPHHGGKR